MYYRNFGPFLDCKRGALQSSWNDQTSSISLGEETMASGRDQPLHAKASTQSEALLQNLNIHFIRK